MIIVIIINFIEKFSFYWITICDLKIFMNMDETERERESNSVCLSVIKREREKVFVCLYVKGLEYQI